MMVSRLAILIKLNHSVVQNVEDSHEILKRDIKEWLETYRSTSAGAINIASINEKHAEKIANVPIDKELTGVEFVLSGDSIDYMRLNRLVNKLSVGERDVFISVED